MVRIHWPSYPGFDTRQVRTFQALGRSGRLDIVTYLLRHPKEERTVRELAALARVPSMTAARAVDELHDLGILRRRRLGAAYAVSLDEGSDAVALLRKLAELATYG